MTNVYVCTHKSFDAPQDELYIPLHVGRALSEALGYQGDDTGDSISEKNKSFCELTGVYWVWKNVDCDIVGICHYRRYFSYDGELLTGEYIEKLLKQDGYDIILPASGRSDYGNNLRHYNKVHFPRDFAVLKEVLLEKHPEYERAWELFCGTNLASLANMIITKKEIYDEYCGWLFDILFEVERRVDISEYNTFQYRLFGYMSERLLRMWIFMHGYRVREEQVILKEDTMQKGRLVLFYGVHDTIDLFTRELYYAFLGMGYECLFFDTRTIPAGLSTLSDFLSRPVTAAIAFNNLAFNMEIIEGQNIWDTLSIPFINILVDHPYCFPEALLDAPDTAIVLTIDKNHMDYVSRFYPRVPMSGFLPHGGRTITTDAKDIRERGIDVLYLGGISKIFIDRITPDFEEYDFDAKTIGREAYELMLVDSAMTVEKAIEDRLKFHGIDLSDEELRDFMPKMRYIDMMIVSHYRENVLRVLAEAGISLTIYGVGWEACEWTKLKNVYFHERIPVAETYGLMNDAKIVLSTMTWFKDGTHERIFNGMLAGAVVVSDTSVYMKESFKYYPKDPADRSELVMFELGETDKLPEMIKCLLADEALMQTIADNGRRRAMITETWKARAEELDRDLLRQL